MILLYKYIRHIRIIYQPYLEKGCVQLYISYHISVKLLSEVTITSHLQKHVKIQQIDVCILNETCYLFIYLYLETAALL